jgi:hypothetical protein
MYGRENSLSRTVDANSCVLFSDMKRQEIAIIKSSQLSLKNSLVKTAVGRDASPCSERTTH